MRMFRPIRPDPFDGMADFYSGLGRLGDRRKNFSGKENDFKLGWFTWVLAPNAQGRHLEFLTNSQVCEKKCGGERKTGRGVD